MVPGNSQDSAVALRAAYIRAGRMLLVLAAFHVGHIVSMFSIASGRGTLKGGDAIIGLSVSVVFLTFVIWVALGVRRGKRIMVGTGVTVFFVIGWMIAVASAVAYNAPVPPVWLIVFEIAYFCVTLLAAVTMIRTQFRHESAKPPSSGQ